MYNKLHWAVKMLGTTLLLSGSLTVTALSQTSSKKISEINQIGCPDKKSVGSCHQGRHWPYTECIHKTASKKKKCLFKSGYFWDYCQLQWVSKGVGVLLNVVIGER